MFVDQREFDMSSPKHQADWNKITYSQQVLFHLLTIFEEIGENKIPAAFYYLISKDNSYYLDAKNAYPAILKVYKIFKKAAPKEYSTKAKIFFIQVVGMALRTGSSNYQSYLYIIFERINTIFEEIISDPKQSMRTGSEQDVLSYCSLELFS